jgi:hypothetical protein
VAAEPPDLAAVGYPGECGLRRTEAARTGLAAAIASLVTRDGGSVIVFCGSKRNVRRTALVIAASRGVDVSGVQQADWPGGTTLALGDRGTATGGYVQPSWGRRTCRRVRASRSGWATVGK